MAGATGEWAWSAADGNVGILSANRSRTCFTRLEMVENSYYGERKNRKVQQAKRINEDVNMKATGHSKETDDWFPVKNVHATCA